MSISADAQRAIVRTAVSALPALTRDILLAHRLEGETVVDLAERLGLSQDEVVAELARALVDIDRALRRADL